MIARRFAGAGAVDEGRRPDEVIVEEPLEIRLDGNLVATTMRTPGHDFELAVGLCLTDGLLGGAPVVTCRYCGTGSALETEFNVVSVDTGGRGPRARGPPRHHLVVVRHLRKHPARRPPRPPRAVARSRAVGARGPYAVTEEVRADQELFGRTGAAHAAASFDRTGAVGVVREDIGRHNAVDKVVGRLLLDDLLPATGHGLFVSGRASFEMVQKAWAAGFEAVIAVSAPSALAVETATAAGLTLAGFVRGDAFNLYTSAG